MKYALFAILLTACSSGDSPTPDARILVIPDAQIISDAQEVEHLYECRHLVISCEGVLTDESTAFCATEREVIQRMVEWNAECDLGLMGCPSGSCSIRCNLVAEVCENS